MLIIPWSFNKNIACYSKINIELLSLAPSILIFCHRKLKFVLDLWLDTPNCAEAWKCMREHSGLFCLILSHTFEVTFDPFKVNLKGFFEKWWDKNGVERPLCRGVGVKKVPKGSRQSSKSE